MPKPSKYHQNGAQNQSRINEKSRLRRGCVFGAFWGAKKPYHLQLLGPFWRPKGAKKQPKGVKREPKVSQRATKMHQKINLRKRSRKGCQKVERVGCFWKPFGDHFRLKIEKMTSKNACKNRCRKSIEK